MKRVAGFVGGQGFKGGTDRAHPIYLRELRAICLLLQGNFARYLSKQEVKRLFVYEDNHAMVAVLSAKVSALRPMMPELRKLAALLKGMGVQIE